MTREEFAKKVRWPFIIWLAGIISIVAMLPQLVKIIATQQVNDFSLFTFVMVFLIQSAFSLEGFFSRNRVVMICSGGSAMVTLSIAVLIVIFGYL